MNSLKLHVGCASKRLEGYVNIDCRMTEAVDHVCRASNIFIAQPGTVCEIYSRHMLEHLDPNEARETLCHWYGLLRADGVLHVIVPDIEFHARQLLGMLESGFKDQKKHAYAGFWGWRDELRGGDREDAHRWGYTEQSIIYELSNVGFQKVQRLRVGEDTEPWHLNILALK